jgi:hypothetical protein
MWRRALVAFGLVTLASAASGRDVADVVTSSIVSLAPRTERRDFTPQRPKEPRRSPPRRAAPVAGPVRFEPSPRLRIFLQQLDELDRHETLASVDRFVWMYGDCIPIRTFASELARGTPMLDALVMTMRKHGAAARESLELVFQLKRQEVAERLEKYLTLAQCGVFKPYKIHAYQQRILLIDELHAEFNKSFRFE